MIHGVINIYKEKGFTSHDVVAKLRGILGQKKIGHTGTLDPDATGVLPVCLGKATKLCDMLTEKDKTYEAVLLLGKTTDTQDITGQVIKETLVNQVDIQEITACIKNYIGAYDQMPPMYSALKVNGRKLYELAREGKEIERSKRTVFIHHINIDKIVLPRIYMTVECSKGTYIRTLCHDIGNDLGFGACMETLQRTRAGAFEIKNSLTLSQIEDQKRQGSLMDHIIPIDMMFETYRKIVVKEGFTPLVYNGNPFPASAIREMLEDQTTSAHLHLKDQEYIRVYDESGRFISIHKYQKEEQYFKIVKMFFDKSEMA